MFQYFDTSNNKKRNGVRLEKQVLDFLLICLLIHIIIVIPLQSRKEKYISMMVLLPAFFPFCFRGSLQKRCIASLTSWQFDSQFCYFWYIFILCMLPFWI